MKNLLVMRHAKSDWGDSSIPDFDRPLNNRGKKAAPFMGKELLKRNKIPDLIISSPAKRARSTAELVAEKIGYTAEIQLEKEFYFGYIDEIIHVLQNVKNDKKKVLIVGHNPTFESLVEILTTNDTYSSMPTASIASINFSVDEWSKLKRESGKLEWILHPKDLMG